MMEKWSWDIVAAFDDISGISKWWVLSADETVVPGEHQIWSGNVIVNIYMTTGRSLGHKWGWDFID